MLFARRGTLEGKLFSLLLHLKQNRHNENKKARCLYEYYKEEKFVCLVVMNRLKNYWTVF